MCRFQLGGVFVGHESYHNRLGSALGDAGGDGVGVDVSDLASLRTGVGGDKFVSGGDDRDFWPSNNAYITDAEREQAADVLGAYGVSGSKQQVASSDILTGVYDVFTWGDGAEYLD